MIVRLFSRLHALSKGIGSVLDLSGGVASLDRPTSDSEALRRDWDAIGRDFEVAISHVDPSVREVKSDQSSLVFDEH